MTQSFGDLPGIETDIDDILVWGKTMEDQNKHLEAALHRCPTIGLTLNKDKCCVGLSVQKGFHLIRKLSEQFQRCHLLKIKKGWSDYLVLSIM